MKKLYFAFMIPIILLSVACGGGKAVKTSSKEVSTDNMFGRETGYAMVYDGDVALARDRAIDDAMNKLVKVKLGTLVEGRALVQDFQLVESVVEAKSSGMVKDWKVVEERNDNGTYILTLEGSVFPQAVKETVRATIENYGRPKFMVLVNESFEGKKNSPGTTVTELSMMNFMGKLGFEFVDAATTKKLVEEEGAKLQSAIRGSLQVDGDVQNLLTNAGAEVVITGDVITNDQTETMKKIDANTTLKSKRATINLKAIDVYTGRILASISTSEAGVAITDYDASKNGVQKALQKKDFIGKSNEEPGDFIKTISNEFIKAATKRMIKLNIAGLEYAELTKLRNAIEQRVRGVSKVFPRGSSGKYSVIEVQFAGKTTDFADELLAKSPAFGFEIKITEAYPTKLMLIVKMKK